MTAALGSRDDAAAATFGKDSTLGKRAHRSAKQRDRHSLSDLYPLLVAWRVSAEPICFEEMLSATAAEDDQLEGDEPEAAIDSAFAPDEDRWVCPTESVVSRYYHQFFLIGGHRQRAPLCARPRDDSTMLAIRPARKRHVPPPPSLRVRTASAPAEADFSVFSCCRSVGVMGLAPSHAALASAKLHGITSGCTAGLRLPFAMSELTRKPTHRAQ
jgi:hypothetical protein